MFSRFVFIQCLVALLALSARADLELSEGSCCASLLSQLVEQPAGEEGAIVEQSVSWSGEEPICSISAKGVDDIACNVEILSSSGLGQNWVVIRLSSNPGAALKCQVDILGRCSVSTTPPPTTLPPVEPSPA